MRQEEDDLVFVGFNRHVVALNRETGAKVWEWKAPQRGYPALLFDGDRLIVSMNGYMYCLAPATGDLLWENNLPGLGMGVSCLASARGSSGSHMLRAAAEDESQSSHAAAAGA
jgi:outer membrane protein assembly factor BamB